MATLTAYAVGDGHIDVQAASWATAKAATSGTATDNDTSGAWLVETAYAVHAAGQYNIRRAFFALDTSSVGAGVVTAGTFKVYIDAIYSGGSLCLVAGSQASTSGLTGTDFDNVGSTELASRITISGITAPGFATFTLNAAGLAAINGSGYTKFAIVHSRDLDNSAPGSGVYEGALATYSEYTGSSRDPVLDLTYTTATAVSASDSGSGTDSGSVGQYATASGSDSATGSEGTSSTVVVPVPYAVGIADDFTGTAGVAIESRTPTGTAARGTWARKRGTLPATKLLLSAAGRAYLQGDAQGLVSADYRADPDQFADGYFAADFYIASATNDYQAIALRHNDATGASSTYYMASLDNGLLGHRGRVVLTKTILGASTDLGYYDIPGFATGNTYNIRLEANGSSLTVKVDGVTRITATDSSIPDAGYPWLLASTAANGGSTTGIHFDNVDASTVVSYALLSDSATGTDTASVTVGVGAIPKTASDSAVATDASAATRFVSTRAGASRTRSAYGSPVTLFPSNGSAGTYGSHYGLHDGIMLPDGTLMVVARKSGGHAVFSGAARGRIVAKTKPPGGSWSAEATILDTAYDERDPCLGLLADGTVCLTWNRLDLDGKAYNGDNGDTKFYAPFMKCPAGSDPMVAANWTTPVHITGAGLANNWRVGTDILELTPGGRIVVALYGTPTYPPWVDDECWIAYTDDGGATWGMLSMLDNGNTHALSSSGEAQLVRCGDGSVLACYRTLASPWETWVRRSTDNCATWSSEWRVATDSVNKTGMVRTPDGDVLIAFNNLSQQLTIAQSFDEGTTFTTTLLGNTGNLYAQPFYFGAQGVGPNAAVVYAYETNAQTISSVYYQELTAGASPGVSLSDSATGTDTGSVTVGVGAIAKTATDSATCTDTGTRSAITRYVVASDSAIAVDSSGNNTAPKLPVRIVKNTYVTSAQFGSRTVSSAMFGDRTVYIHPESTIEFS